MYLATKGSLLVFLILQSELDVTFLMMWLRGWDYCFQPSAHRKETQYSSNREHPCPQIPHSSSSLKFNVRGESKCLEEATLYLSCYSNALGALPREKAWRYVKIWDTFVKGTNFISYPSQNGLEGDGKCLHAWRGGGTFGHCWRA